MSLCQGSLLLINECRSEALREAAAGALACVLHHSPQQLAAVVAKYGARMLVAGAAGGRGLVPLKICLGSSILLLWQTAAELAIAVKPG